MNVDFCYAATFSSTSYKLCVSSRKTYLYDVAGSLNTKHVTGWNKAAYFTARCGNERHGEY